MHESHPLKERYFLQQAIHLTKNDDKAPVNLFGKMQGSISLLPTIPVQTLIKNRWCLNSSSLAYFRGFSSDQTCVL